MYSIALVVSMHYLPFFLNRKMGVKEEISSCGAYKVFSMPINSIIGIVYLDQHIFEHNPLKIL